MQNLMNKGTRIKQFYGYIQDAISNHIQSFLVGKPCPKPEKKTLKNHYGRYFSIFISNCDYLFPQEKIRFP